MLSGCGPRVSGSIALLSLLPPISARDFDSAGRDSRPERRGFARCGRNPQASAADVHHAAGRLDKARFADMMTRFLLVDHGTNVIGQLVVRGPVVHAAGQVVVEKREQAGAELAVRG